MKIDPTRGASVQSVRLGKTAAADGFSQALQGAQESSETARTIAVGSLAPLDALMALQLDPHGRRKRQVRRGAASLDALDGLTAALLGAGNESDALHRLTQTLAEREATDDAGLDAVLEEIDVRAAVELAKRERRASAMAKA